MDSERKRAKVLFAKLVARFKKRHLAAKTEIIAARAELLSEHQKLEAEREKFAAERREFQKDTDLYKHRLTDAWNLIADGQRRLIHDRVAVEETLAQQQIALETRTNELAALETSTKKICDELHTQKTALQSEIAGLETRAFHLQLAVQELQTQRSAATLDAAMEAKGPMVYTAQDLTAPVPLDARKDKSFEQLLTEVTIQERNLNQERQQLSRAKTELQKLATELADQRSVLAEQFAKLAAAKDVWHQNETTTVKELEDLARALNGREKSLLARDKTICHTEETLAKKDRELNTFRMKLESWQAGLTAHESQWYATKDALQIELDRKREHLATCELSLQELAKQWAIAWKAERETVKAKYESAIRETETTLVGLKAYYQDALTLAEKASLVAAASVAVEATKQELLGTNPKAEKKLRVMTKGWERHFAGLTRKITAQEKYTTRAAQNLKAQEDALNTALANMAEKTAKKVDTKRVADQTQWDKARAEGEHATTLSIEVARRERTERTVNELRKEVDRLKNLLEVEAEVVPLQKAA